METARKGLGSARKEKGFGLARLPSGLCTCSSRLREAKAICLKRTRVDRTCETPTELYARDTAGRSADSHSPFLSYLSHTRPLRQERSEKNERSEKPFGNHCESERER